VISAWCTSQQALQKEKKMDISYKNDKAVQIFTLIFFSLQLSRTKCELLEIQSQTHFT
jgi:hypothetical protein